MPDQDRKKTPCTLILHPFLFAAFPVFFLYAQNIEQFSPGVMALPLAVLLASAAVLWGLLSLLIRNARKAGLVASLFMLLLFSYGTAWRAMPMFKHRVLGVAIEPTKVILGIWMVLFLAVAWLILRKRSNLRPFTRIVNVTAIVLVGISVFNIAFYELSSRGGSSATEGASQDDKGVIAPDAGETYPDIYWIILDAYGRQDVLKDIYDCDVSGFLDFLRGKGFYVAEGSTPNYSFTALSLSSALNMNYVPKLLPDLDTEVNDRTPMRTLMRHSRVVKFLKQHGYTTVAFATGYAVTEMPGADVYLTPGWFSSEFPNALLEMTPITIFYKRMSFARYHRERVLYVLNRLPEVAALKSPKFVFVHIVSPHNPFVFGPDGEPVNPRDLNKRIQKLWTTGIDPKRFRRFYRDQVTYLNKRMQGVIEQILARSERPPVIILQGDHGPWSQFDNGKHTDACIKERFAILNAYHLPGDGQTELYPDISPVNSFRIVLNRYFGQDFELLEDRCWFSMADSLYRLREVTDLVRPKTDEKPNPPTSR